MRALPPLCELEEIRDRLARIFPEGIHHRQYVIREMSAKTIFVMLYIGAIEDKGIWLRPDQVTRMTDEQAERVSDDARIDWERYSRKPQKEAPSGRWYAQNTREPIRDETLRQGLVEFGAVVVREDLPTTSPKGRHALSTSFCALFDPCLKDDQLDEKIHSWREHNLSRNALARLAILKNATVVTDQGVLVTFPNKETRRLTPGPSSLIAKAVIEAFAPRYLEVPGVLWLSESANKEDRRNATLMKALNFEIEMDKNLPDLILVDLGREPLFLFVEIVATDGAITPRRKQALAKILEKAGYREHQAAYLTAFKDRGDAAFRKCFPELAWETFVWTASEPENLISLYCDMKTAKLRHLIG